MLQDGGVGVDGLVSAGPAQVERVVHVGVGGGEPSSLQPTEERRDKTTEGARRPEEQTEGCVLPESSTCELLCAVVMVTVMGSSVLQQLQPSLLLT